MPIVKLIDSVNAFLANDLITSTEEQYLVLDFGQYDEEDKRESENAVILSEGEVGYAELDAIAEYAESTLVTPGGNPNYDAMEELKEATGCKVTKGESDSFGWLTGVINTPKGKYVYG